MPKAILPCTFSIISYAPGDSPPGDYVGPYLGPIPNDFDKHLYVALCEPPYVRPLNPDETAQAQRDALADGWYSQVRSYSQVKLAEDDSRAEETRQDLAKYVAAVGVLANTEDADVGTLSTTLADYEMSTADYARSLVRQETALLTAHNAEVAAGGAGLLSTDERTEVVARIPVNDAVARVGGTVQVPTRGAPRGRVVLEDEVAETALFVETTFDWNGTPYFIPQVTLESMPAGVTPAQVYAMLYNESNVYLTWLPFQQQADGSWITPATTSYISAAKTESSPWRVAIAYQGTSAEYEITERVYLVPPGAVIGPVRWGGRDTTIARRARGNIGKTK